MIVHLTESEVLPLLDLGEWVHVQHYGDFQEFDVVVSYGAFTWFVEVHVMRTGAVVFPGRAAGKSDSLVMLRRCCKKVVTKEMWEECADE